MKTISKVPVAQEDVSIGVGKIIQQRGQESVEVQQCELSWIFRTTGEIRGLDITKYTRVLLHETGAALEYWYDATSMSTDNGTTVLKPDATDPAAAGRWLQAVGGASSGAFVPLSGTLDGFPVTGPIKFQSSLNEDLFSMQTDILGADSFGFVAQRDDVGFIITTRDTGGINQSFGFTGDGEFLIPSNLGTNDEGWSMKAVTLGGSDNTLTFSSRDSLEQLRTNPIAFTVSPTATFILESDGHAEAPRQTVGGDPDLSLTTKAYVDGLLPPGGGEANTASSPGASGESLVMAKVGIDLPFKKLIAGTDITLTPSADGITIDGSGGGGGGLPAGLINQGLRNDAGTNTYEASAGLLIDAAGNVSIGPASLAPTVALQIQGDSLIRTGGIMTFNNAGNSSASAIQNIAGRLTFDAPVDGGIDVKGAVTLGKAVRIMANEQEVFVAQSDVSSWAQILQGGDVRYRTTAAGCDMHGNLIVRNVLSLDPMFEVESTGNAHFYNDLVVEIDFYCNGDGIFAGIATSGIISTGQVQVTAAQGASADALTKKEYVDAALAGKAPTSTTVTTNTTQSITGTKSFTSNLTWSGAIGSSLTLNSGSFPLVISAFGGSGTRFLKTDNNGTIFASVS